MKNESIIYSSVENRRPASSVCRDHPKGSAHGFHLYLVFQGKLVSAIDLPDYPEGKREFDLSEVDESFSFWIQGEQGCWHAVCSESVWIENEDGLKTSKLPLPESGIVSLTNGAKRVTIFIYPSSNEQSRMVNVSLENRSSIRIGRSADSDIQLLNPLASRNHAVIEKTGSGLRLVDVKSAFGSYLNGERISSARLQLGDRIELPGTTIIAGINFLSVHVSPSQCRIHSLEPVSLPALTRNMRLHQKEEYVFYRKPRTRAYYFEPETVAIELPPMQISGEKIPLALRMGGPAVFSGVSAMSGNYTSMISSVLFPVLTSKYTDRQKQEYESRRKTKYLAYLSQLSARIQRIQAQEMASLKDNNPSAAELSSLIDSRHRLWERRIGDPDFLNLRLGEGDVPLKSVISYPKKSFGVDEDPLANRMYSFAEQDFGLHQAPIAVNFFEDFNCGFRGAIEEKQKAALNLILEICYLYSPDEVKIIFLGDEEDLAFFSAIRYLPHFWDSSKDIRYIATNTSECALLSSRFAEKIEKRLTKNFDAKTILKEPPYYVVLSFSLPLLNAFSALEPIQRADRNYGFSVLSFSSSLPNSSRILVDLNGENSKILQLAHQEKKDISFVPEETHPDRMNRTLSQISNLLLPRAEDKDTLPNMVSFLEMYRAGRVEHLSVIRRWQDSNPMKSLAAPVGVNPDGSLFMLDLHEKHHGPHGLIAGMTGSGKSEFIISYILSMAVNYHPDEVSFILIDFKGGGLTGAFEDESRQIRLPHLAGTITNLDESTMSRALASIESELKRRQKIFNQAKSMANEGTMDIYGYQQLYRNGRVKEPVSHLFIISDEFAELKSQQPEFMDQLISTARIGRSLGVHLILATQKPAGVVNEQIWSNSRFKVCLKVQDRVDSMDMIKRPEAAELKETGRFYLQVGYNEYFSIGQSAWAGAAYEPADQLIRQPDHEILFVDPTGQPAFRIKPSKQKRERENTQLVEIMQHLTRLAEDLDVAARPLWLDPLPPQIDLDELSPSGEKWTATVGMTDDPSKQEQNILNLNLRKCGNLLVCGDAASGKSTFLQTLLLSLLRHHSPEQLQLYLIDYPGKTFGSVKNLCHTGCVFLRPEMDEMNRLMSRLQGILDDRKNLFIQHGMTRFEDVHEETGLPLILFVIDGYEEVPDDRTGRALQESIAAIAREGPGYGLQLIVAAGSLKSLTLKVRSEMTYFIPFHLREQFQYYDIFGRKPAFFPETAAGRGLVREDRKIIEFQAARFHAFCSESERSRLLKEEVSKLNAKYEFSRRPEQILTLDRRLSYADFLKTCKRGRIPCGLIYETVLPVSIPLQQLFTLSLYFGSDEVKELVSDFWKQAVKFNHGKSVRFGRKHAQTNEDLYFPETREGVSDLVDWLSEQIALRTAIRKSICQELGIEEWKDPAMRKIWRKEMRKQSEPLFLMIDSFVSLCSLLRDQQSAVVETVLDLADGYNLYIGGGFSFDDKTRLGALSEKFSDHEQETLSPRDKYSRIRTKFSEGPGLLFGGRFADQTLYRLPFEMEKITAPFERQNMNQVLLIAGGKIGRILFPMGDLEVNNLEDEDDLPIL